MKEFSENEKIIARNINKKFKWMARNKDGLLYAHPSKPTKKEKSWDNDCHYCFFVGAFFVQELFKSIKWYDDEPTLIKDIYTPHILNDAEREYLEAVLRPFLNRVLHVVKGNDGEDMEFIYVVINDDGTGYRFPSFKKDEKYIGMKSGHAYSLHELGITYD